MAEKFDGAVIAGRTISGAKGSEVIAAQGAMKRLARTNHPECGHGGGSCSDATSSVKSLERGWHRASLPESRRPTVASKPTSATFSPSQAWVRVSIGNPAGELGGGIRKNLRGCPVHLNTGEKRKMEKVAVVVLSEMEEHADLGRVTNALQVVKEFKEHGDDVRLVFDGAGVVSAVTLADPEHRLHRLYNQVEDKLDGICRYCSRAFHVYERAEELGLPFLADYNQHPSIRNLIVEGYQVLTF